MTDVLKIAIERRDKMRAEVERLEDFIATAEGILRESGAEVPAETKSSEETPRKLGDSKPAASGDGTDVPRPSIIRRGLAS